MEAIIFGVGVTIVTFPVFYEAIKYAVSIVNSKRYPNVK